MDIAHRLRPCSCTYSYTHEIEEALNSKFRLQRPSRRLRSLMCHLWGDATFRHPRVAAFHQRGSQWSLALGELRQFWPG